MIRKVQGGYKATSESGRPLSRQAKSKADAMKQLYAVEMSKARRAGGSSSRAGMKVKAMMKMAGKC